MITIEQLKQQHQQSIDAMGSILENSIGALTTEQQTDFDNHKAQAEGLKVQIDNHEQLAKAKAENARIVRSKTTILDRQTGSDTTILADPTAGLTDQSPRIKIPVKANRWAGRLQSFKGKDAAINAYKVGMWLAATLCNSSFAKNFCRTHGLMTERVELDPQDIQSLHQEGVNALGGYLVFDEMENTIIRLVEEFGLARRIMKVVPMISDVNIRPRRTGGVIANFVGEGAQISQSTGSWDNVKLVAKKLAAIAVASNELISDAIISIADELIREIALAFATKEDETAFQGDGTSTYGGIVGIVQKLSTINGVDDGGGLVLAAGNTFADVTDANLVKMIGQVPNFPGLRPEWICSKPFWAQVMIRLIRATGGATMAEFEGKQRLMYAGYPVNWTSGTVAMPVSDANSQINCLFGDIKMAAMFGDRAGIMIATTTDANVGDTSMFDTDSFAIRGIERFDINAHDLGTATAAGPMVGLISASS